MPDISKFSGTLIDGVSKVDGVLKDSISTIDGIALPPLLPYTPPLDVFSNAVLAYSVRKIRTDYAGPCLEAYRSSDGATLDIGFDANGLLSEAELAAFYDGTPILVSRWYDQSTSANDMVQATPADMPTVYADFSSSWAAGGVTVGRLRPNQLAGQDPLNSSFTITATGTVTTKRMDVVTPITSVGPTYSIQCISNGTTNSTNIYGNTGGATLLTRINKTVYNGGGLFTIADNSNGQNTLLVRRSSSADLNFNGLTAPSGTMLGNSSSLGNFHLWDSQFVTQYNGNISEFIMFSDDKWSNMGAIVNNSGSYFNTSLVVNPDAATSGFLFDYPGATSAYSIRQLNNNATASMRVRRNVAPFDEQDIGFDGSGNLDTTAIATFGGSDEVVISRFYDQTGACNHTNSIAASAELLIYDGASVLTKNGKPIGQVHATSGTSNVTISMNYSTGLSFTHSLYAVGQRPNAPNALNMFGTTNTSVTALYQERSGNLTYGPGWTTYGIYTYSAVNNTPRLWSYIRKNGTDGECFNDGVSQGTTTAMDPAIQVDIKSMRIDRNSSGVQADCGGVQEFIAYPDDRTSVGDNANILANIKAYFTGIP